MRLRAGMGALLLALGGCAGLPEEIRLDIDGRWIELRQHGLDGARWALDPECRKFVRLEGHSDIRPDAAGGLTGTDRDGRQVRLYPCR